MRWIRCLVIAVGIFFLAGCAAQIDEEVVLPTRIILPTPTQILISVSTPKSESPSPALVINQPSTPKNTPVPAVTEGRFYSGDIHNHTWLTDGDFTEADILSHAFDLFHLDYLADSEHGGAFPHNPDGKYWNDPSLPPLKVLGNPPTLKIKNPNGQPFLETEMWRWQSLRDFSWPLLFGGKDGYGVVQPGLQAQYPTHLLIQGVEWNVPTHEHASVGLINQANGTAISQFEYQYDQNDRDTSLANLTKHNATHDDALAAVKDLADRFGQNAYVVINHPSRAMAFTVSDLRELNDAAPFTVIGLEGFPGHQKAKKRGDYNFSPADRADSYRARTFGGADFMLAKLGGVMDALWGEGRRFWVFDDSDFHNDAETEDFWPGEYGKTYTFARDLSAAHVVEGMRSGQVFIVSGDLINGLDFHAAADGVQAVMGGELNAAGGADVTVTIRFQSPEKNNHGDAVRVDHIDLIAGDVVPRAYPESEAYKKDYNLSTQVVKTFTSADWKDENGMKNMTFSFKAVKNQYLRLRGTNLGLNVPDQTQKGNPLNDDLVGDNSPAKAWADLWFYSNPIFVKVQP